MPMTAVYLRHRRPVDYGTAPGSTTISRRGRELFRRFANLAMGALSDAQADSEYTLVYGGSTEPAFANAGLAISSGAGAVGATLNGVAVTATYATSDTNSAALIAAAINASTNALVQGFFIASNLTATLTLTSVAAGDTVEIGGFQFVANSGTRPNYVSGANLGYFDVSGNDAADATSLAAAINSCPSLDRYVFAVPVSNVVRLFVARANYAAATNTFSFPTGPGVPTNNIFSRASTIVASGGSLVAGAFVGIEAGVPGVVGNAFTIAASGTGVSVLNTETRLNRGAALNILGVTDNC
jgi:hypothetical protein